jgi:hypothetical protein
VDLVVVEVGAEFDDEAVEEGVLEGFLCDSERSILYDGEVVTDVLKR